MNLIELISQLETNAKTVEETEITQHGPYGIEGFSQENLAFAKKVAETLSAQNLAHYLALEQQFFIDQLHYKTKQEKIAAKKEIEKSQTVAEMQQKVKHLSQRYCDDQRKLKDLKKHLEGLKVYSQYHTLLSDPKEWRARAASTDPTFVDEKQSYWKERLNSDSS